MLKKSQNLLFLYLFFIFNLYSSNQNNTTTEAIIENVEKKTSIIDNCFDFVIINTSKVFDSCKKYAKIGLAKTIIKSQEILKAVVKYLKSGKEIVSEKLEKTVSWAKEIEEQNKEEK
jgi:hypothetical protein